MSSTSCGMCPGRRSSSPSPPTPSVPAAPTSWAPTCVTHRKGQAIRPQDRGVFRAGGKGIRLPGPHPGDRCQSHPRDAGRYLPGLLLVPHQRLLQEYLRRQIREITFSPIQQGRRAGDDPARRPVCFILFLRPAPLHRPSGDTGGPGILLAQPAELLAHMSGH